MPPAPDAPAASSLASHLAGKSHGGLRLVTALEDLDDAALVDAIRAGVARALSVLFDRYAAVVERLLTRLLGPDGDRADLLNEVFLRALDRLDDLHEASGLRPWLLTMAVFVAREQMRKRRRRRWLLLWPSERLPEPPDHSHGDANDARETVRRVYRVLDRLADDDRELFVLRFIEQMELREIARIRGVSLATLKRHVQRAEERFLAAAKRDPLLADYAGGMSP